MVFNSLLWNGILSTIEVLLHDGWTTDVDFFNCSRGFKLFKILSVIILVHPPAYWLSNLLAFLNFANSAIMSKQIIQMMFFAKIDEDINEFKTHCFFFTCERSMKFELKGIKIKRLIASVNMAWSRKFLAILRVTELFTRI